MGAQMPGLAVATKQAVYALIPDADEQALAWIQAWADKVPSGTQMIFAKMKCALADGPCGCPEDAYVYKCRGPYPPVPIEIIADLLLPPDGGPCPVAGVEGVMLLAPQAIVVDAHVHEVEFMGPGKSLYVKKI
ncbi:hypothetical protein [Streptomyces sp. bgisy153]|uniref:hypothetical protein n=1 Tax=Streptomyces sp. bgisy153 TaxID=3413793 RepID=UPI003D7547A3